MLDAESVTLQADHGSICLASNNKKKVLHYVVRRNRRMLDAETVAFGKKAIHMLDAEAATLQAEHGSVCLTSNNKKKILY